MNIIELQGNLTANPEVKTTKSGKTLTTFSVAVNKLYTMKNGQRGKKTSYFRVVAWETLGKAASYLVKGQNVVIRGSADPQNWQDSEGKWRQSNEVTASSISIPITYLFRELVKDQGVFQAGMNHDAAKEETVATEAPASMASVSKEDNDPWTGFGKREPEGGSASPVEPGKPLM